MDRPPKLLVIDDGAEAHQMVELLFSVPGGTGPRPVLLHADDGREGLSLLQSHQDTDAIVLDLQMPVMDGFEFLTRIRQDRRLSGIPVLVFSGNREDSTKALKLGARDFVNKPGDYVEIHLRILNLIEGKRKTEAADRMRTDFLSVVSHELRTPMNGILGMAQTLKDSGLNDEQSLYLDALERSSDKMLTLVNNVLSYLESDSPLHTLPRTAFSLEGLLRATVDAQADRAAQNGVTLELSLEPEVPDRLVGLPDKLQTALGHLIGNAVKFSPGGRVTVGVGREPSDTGVVLRFSVQDNGVGFAPERKESLFEPFVQADGSETRRFGGLGIGLSIASRLLGRLGGILDASSLPGRGSRFEFTLTFDAE